MTVGGERCRRLRSKYNWMWIELAHVCVNVSSIEPLAYIIREVIKQVLEIEIPIIFYQRICNGFSIVNYFYQSPLCC